MAQPQTASLSEFLFMLGNGNSPEKFTQAPLAMTTRGFTTTVSTNKITVPDEDDEDAMVDERAVATTRTRSCTGKGVLGKGGYAHWENRLGTTFDIQVSLADVGTWTGPVILTQLNISADRANVLEVDVTMEQADELVFDED